MKSCEELFFSFLGSEKLSKKLISTWRCVSCQHLKQTKRTALSFKTSKCKYHSIFRAVTINLFFFFFVNDFITNNSNSSTINATQYKQCWIVERWVVVGLKYSMHQLYNNCKITKQQSARIKHNNRKRAIELNISPARVRCYAHIWSENFFCYSSSTHHRLLPHYYRHDWLDCWVNKGRFLFDHSWMSRFSWYGDQWDTVYQPNIKVNKLWTRSSKKKKLFILFTFLTDQVANPYFTLNIISSIQSRNNKNRRKYNTFHKHALVTNLS